MIRTQFQLDKDTYEALRRMAHRKRKSMSSVVRDILRDHFLTAKKHNSEGLSFVGAGASGRSDISVHHDEALAEDFE
jgi:hypothetical protein